MGIFDKAKNLVTRRGKSAGPDQGTSAANADQSSNPVADAPISQADTTGLTEPIADKTPPRSESTAPAEEPNRPADEDLQTQAGSVADAESGATGPGEAQPQSEVSDADADTDTDVGAEGDMAAPDGDFRPTGQDS